MRILALHNSYKWPGGEDSTFADEVQLLRDHGHEVMEHVADNKDMFKRGKLATLYSLWRAAWSTASYRVVQKLAKDLRPDVVHVHNFWFALSPSVLAACHDAGFPVVLRLPNFRLLCPGGVFLNTEGLPCQDCLDRGPGLGVRRRCYHNSLLASWAVARMIRVNRRRRTWQKDVDLFLVPSQFCKEVYARGGFPKDKIIVKPNFVRDPYADAGPNDEGREPKEPHRGQKIQFLSAQPRVLFIGRLSREKGLMTLLAAWKKIQAEFPDAELRMVGDGPMREALEVLGEGLNVSFAGRVEGSNLFREIAAARFTVLPSECYETFGRVVIESYACGRPVVVSNLGGPAELVRDGETGLLFESGDAPALAVKLARFLGDEKACRDAGAVAREEYLRRYTPHLNYEMLLGCYEQVRRTCSDAGKLQ